MLQKQNAYFTPSRDIRPLHIWLPEDYDRTDERYPVMYMFDGHNLFQDSSATYGTCWGLMDFFRRWPKPMICVGLECSHRGRERLKEYCPYHFRDAFFGDLQGIGAETLDWMVHTLKPEIDRTFRTYSFREATGIGGSSMGGLMSLYGVIHHNQTFSKAACLSSTVTPCLEQLLGDIRDTPLNPDTRVYLSWGEQEGRGAAEKLNDDFDTYTARCNQAIDAALREKDVTTRLYLQPGGGHCEADWAKQVPQFMDFLWRS
ncbi:MAG: alpha/beta hydrolase [Oscillospiraceae bacterium]|nr:alpha/beta hydrolase [Oscillospiraceae bacterium]